MVKPPGHSIMQNSTNFLWKASYKCNTVEPPCATTNRKRPPPISDHAPIQNTKTFPVKALQLEPLVSKWLWPLLLLFCFVFLYHIFLYLLAGFNLFTLLPHHSIASCCGECISSNFIFFTGINLYIPSAAQGQQQKLSLTLEEWQL